MPSKVEYYAQLADATARGLTANHENWTAFLTTAGRVYKYPYQDQVLIFAQRPNATACADYDLWKDIMHRYVKRGSNGIALLRIGDNGQKLHYVFDVADTGTRRNSRTPFLWQMAQEHERPIQEALARGYAIPPEVGRLEDQMEMIATEQALFYWDEHGQELLDIVAGSRLEDYDSSSIGLNFHKAAVNSILYQVFSRCFGNPEDFFQPEDFVAVSDFNTIDTINALGTAVNQISSQILREVERTIRSYERTKRQERSQHHEQPDLHEERRLQHPQPEADRDRTETSGQVGTDAQELSGAAQADPVHPADSQREAVPPPVGDRRDSGAPDEADDEPAAEAESGPGQGEEPDGLGTAHEQPESTGRGSDSDGADHSVSPETSQIEQLTMSMFPSEQETIEAIDAEAESEKPSAFVIDDREINRILRSGSGMEHGKLRIMEAFEQKSTTRERAEFLKKEYGIGGRSWTFPDDSTGFLDYNGKGLEIRMYGSDQQMRLSWTNAANRIDTLILANQYLTEKEQAQYDRRNQPEREETEEREEPESEPELETVEKEPEPNAADFPYQAGDTVTIDGTPFVVESVGMFDVHLRDTTSIYPILRAESRENLLRLMESEQSKEPEEAEEPKEEAEEPELIEAELVPGVPARNYRITDDRLGEGGPKQKFARNVEAIRTLFQLEQEHRNATPEEQEVLASYVGWGGLADAFDPDKDSWAQEYTQLKELLSEQEYADARASTLNAHYTSPTVIRAIYDAVAQMGFQNGNILEPSMGVGNFFGMLPEAMQDSKLYGVELDSITGRIAQKLYPNANITVAGFEQTDTRDFYDLAVGNVPFGNYKVSDKPYDKLGFSIHNYFFAKTIDQVRPGGVIAFVTSRYTMDSKDTSARAYIAQRADLLGAIRLPNTAFRNNAGTDVVSDILFLQKRDRPLTVEPDWVHLGLTGDGLPINSYYIEHPEMVLGELTAESTRYGRDDLTVVPTPGTELSQQLSEAVARIHGSYQAAEMTEDEELEEQQETIPADPNVKNYSYALVDGQVYYRENSIMRHMDLKDNARLRVAGMITLREVVNELIDYQLNDYPEEDIKTKQMELSALYDRFTKEYGILNSTQNAKAFEQDSSYYLLCSLENVDEDGKLISKADMFNRRTIRPAKAVTSVDTPSEALAVSIGEHGQVDLSYMSSLLGTPGEYGRILEELHGVIFRIPEHLSEGEQPRYVTADEYLSGNVRQKLQTARLAAQSDPAYQINVEALEKAQPKELEASEIDVRLGATWIEPRFIQQFMEETFSMPFYLARTVQVQFSSITAEWRIENKGSVNKYDVASRVTYGTDRASAYKILEDTLNLKDVRIFDQVDDENGKPKRVLNKKETMLAQQKQQVIKDAFQDWIWKNPYRREALVKRYNELFNSTRPREYDGSHIRFGGMNPEIMLRSHQVNAIAHVLYGGNTLLAHEVGSGKTFEMTASAMESKRLGLCHKSLFVVPNHLTMQWASEFLRLYPSAKLLVATRKDFATARRKKFCARIATGDYDAVIIGHSQFEKIPLSIERQQDSLQKQIDEIEEAVGELKYSRGERFTVKQMEKLKKTLQARLEKLNNTERKDDVITFEQLGIDRLFVDESHAYKNLFLYTKMRNVAGLSTSEAQKSSDMFMKCQYMDELTGGRGVIFATGTPVSNSMTELYTLMRYLQYGTLQRMGLTHFDCWASTFGETTTAIELAPEGTGYRARTRFARFFNLPELMNVFKEVADIKTSDQLQLPVPEAKYETVVVQPSEMQKDMVAALSERAGLIHNGAVDPSVDNMLKVTSDGRKIGLDQRLMNPMLPDDPNSKVNTCVRNVLRIWEEGKDQRLTQLLFCDMSVPKNDGTFNVYDDVKAKLMAGGVPEEEIAFIHTADTESKKKELFGRVRTGQVRILLGSTSKMGAGTNVQDLLVAVHHLDIGWRPADLTQRNGRIIRQGNQNSQVQIYNYVTNGTFDAYLWQMMENKQRFISQIMTSKSPVRSCEDVDEQVLSYAEVKALCAGDERIKEKMDLDIQVAKLKLLRSDYQSQQFRLEDKLLKYYPAKIEEQRGFIKSLEADQQLAESHPQSEDGFCGMEIHGMQFDDKLEAGTAILDGCKELKGTDPVSFGTYRGFQTALEYEPFANEYRFVMKGAVRHTAILGTDPRGNMIRIDNVLANIPGRLETARIALEDLCKQQEATRGELGKPFPQEAEYVEKSARLAELDAVLNMDDHSQPLPAEPQRDSDLADGQDCSINRRIHDRDGEVL